MPPNFVGIDLATAESVDRGRRRRPFGNFRSVRLFGQSPEATVPTFIAWIHLAGERWEGLKVTPDNRSSLIFHLVALSDGNVFSAHLDSAYGPARPFF